MSKNIIYLFILILLAGAFFFYLYREGRDIEIDIPSGDIENGNGQSETPELPAQEGLPPQAEAKRQAIYQAAVSGDYESLAALAEPNISYSFGGPLEGGFIAFLKRAKDAEGKNALDIIPQLLTLPYTKMRETNIYAWPSVFSKTAEEWTEEDMAQMRTLMSNEMIESYRRFGAYAYWRIGITEDGKWVYYIAGD